MFCSNFNKCSKCEWSHTLTENDHRNQCKYRYGLSTDTIYDGEKQIFLTPADIKNNLKNCDTHKINLNAKNVVWSAEVTHQLSESKSRNGKRSNMIFLKISFLKGITKKADENFVNICFNIHLKTDEDPKTSFINRHVFLESKKWGKGADGVFETELIKASLLKGHKSDIRISVVPTICNLDEGGRFKVQGYPDDGYSEVYRMIGTDFDRDGISSLIFPKDKATEENPNFVKSAVKRKRENLLNSIVASDHSISSVTKRIKPIENDSGIYLDSPLSTGYIQSNISAHGNIITTSEKTAPTKIKLTNTGLKDWSKIELKKRPIAKMVNAGFGEQKSERHQINFERRYIEIENTNTVEQDSDSSENTKLVESNAFFKTTTDFVTTTNKMIDELWTDEDAKGVKQFHEEFEFMKLRLNKLEKEGTERKAN